MKIQWYILTITATGLATGNIMGRDFDNIVEIDRSQQCPATSIAGYLNTQPITGNLTKEVLQTHVINNLTDSPITVTIHGMDDNHTWTQQTFKLDPHPQGGNETTFN